MNKIITRALMRHHNDFFKLTEEEQDIFKLQEHDDLDDKIEAFINKELGLNDDDKDHYKLLEYNKINLHYIGIGPNYFMLNEFGWKQEVLKYKNFYEYNEANHNFQEEPDENFPNKTPHSLFNRLNDWARTEIDGGFFYLNLYSYQIWVHYALEEAQTDWIDEHIPYDLVDGPNNGKKEEGGYVWDMRRDAHGKEGWLEQMQDFGYKWVGEFYDNSIYDEKWNMVFINDTSGEDYDGDPNKEYIFGSVDCLKNISFKTFVDDCKKLQGDSKLAYQFRDQAIEEFIAVLDKEFIEVQKTAPNVVKLKKKMKVKVAEGAFDGLVD